MRMAQKKTGGSTGIRFLFTFSFVFLFIVFAQAGILNEWGFSSDLAGRVLSEANNFGSEGIAFAAGDEDDLATDGTNALVCTQDDPGSTTGMWTNGAILNAATPSTVSNTVQYLRCDLTYDLSDTNNLNDSGGVVGFAFYDTTGSQVAGVALERDVGAGTSSPYPKTRVTNLPVAGIITMIAKVDLASQTMEVWYDLAGDVSGFSELSPDAQKSVSIGSFDSLRFHATGDIQPVGSSDVVTVDLLRTADTWASIMADEGVFLPELQIAVTSSASMVVGENNLVTIVISNNGSPATEVTSTLIHDGDPSDFTIVSDNAPAPLGAGEFLTNTYWLTANADGGYEFTAQAVSTETNSLTAGFDLQVGQRTGRYLNEWIFERDAEGLPLNQATNSGTAMPQAQFDAGFDSTVFTTNRALLCTGEDPGTDGGWTNGAVLDAGIDPATTGKHYLRYDVAYDFSSTNENNSGNVLGVYFTDSTGDQAGGLILAYDVVRMESVAPSSRPVIRIPGTFPLSGSLSAIAEVDLDNNTLKVWYDLSGNNVFDENSPAAAKSITMTSLDHLTFHATGDLRPDGTDDYAAVDNIRHAASWDEIVEPPPDVTAPGLRVTVKAPDVVMVGGSNLVTVVINNVGQSAANVASTLIHDGVPSDFTVVSNNAPVSLESGAFHTNTYWLTAHANGGYVFTAQAFSTETSSPAVDFDLWVGPRVSFAGETVTEIGGVDDFPGLYEPGEILRITIANINDGAITVTNVTNSLSANPGTFSITPLTPTVYPVLTVGQESATAYEVTISPSAAHGTYTFDVQNATADGSWDGHFTLDVFAQGLPVLSPLFVDLSAAEGLPDTATVTVSNAGSKALSFTVSDDAFWSAEYTRKAQSPFWHAAYTFIPLTGTSPETDGISEVIDFGAFDFSFYGKSYSGFYVTSDGVIGLSNSTNASALGNGGGDLPNGSLPLIAPFWGDLRVPSSGAIQYSASTDRVVISWIGVEEIGGATGLEFQARLYADGQIDFGYKEIPDGSLNDITVGLQGDAFHFINLDITPNVGVDQRMTPAGEDRWVWYEPTPATVNPGESIEVTFRIGPNAQGNWPMEGRTQEFDAQFSWSTGGSSNVAVTAEVRPVPVLRGTLYHSERMEEGETITATAIVTNFGGLATAVTTTLTHDGSPADFTIVSNNAPVSMENGAVLTNTYQLTANTVGNYTFTSWLLSAETDGEVVSYPLEVFPRTERLITPDSVTLSAVEGQPDTEIVTVQNRGDTPFSFTLSDDAEWNVEYTRTARSFAWHAAYTVIPLNGTSPETDGISEVIDLGFPFPFYGQNYSGFYVTSDGVIGLSNSTNALALGNGGGDLPNGSQPLIAPFWGDLRVSSSGALYYSASAGRVVISWIGVDEIGGGTGLEFQARLYADGQIDFSYQEIPSGSPNNITVGLQGDATHYTNLTVTPIERVDQRWTPQGDDRWVWYEPGEADLQPGESVNVTFRIGPNRAGQWPVEGSTRSFNAWFNWNNGDAFGIPVFAEVVEPIPQYQLSILSGAGGSVSPAGGWYDEGSAVGLTATPDQYYQFGGWSGTGTNSLTTGGTTDPVVTVTINNTVSLSASFSADTASGGTPHWWLAQQDPAWSNDFEAAATNDVDGDGATADEEYVAGTSATNALSVFALGVDGLVVSFQTLETTEAYGGLTRTYDFQRRLGLLSGLWLGVPGYTNLIGDGQSVIYTNSPTSNAPAFFRGRVWLEE